jgi:hypothetical protein
LKTEVVSASMRQSGLWSAFTIQHLIRSIQNAREPEIANMVDSIGDGAGKRQPPKVSLDLIPAVARVIGVFHIFISADIAHIRIYTNIDKYNCQALSDRI